MKPHSILYILFLVFLSGLRVQAQTYDTNGDFVQTFVGSGFSGEVDGVGQLTMFENPNQIAVDSFGDFFVGDDNGELIRKITADGTVSTFAGGGNQTSGYGTNATVYDGTTTSILVDHTNTLWICGSYGYLISVGTNAFVTRTLLNGPAWPWGLCMDSANNLYISDYSGNKIYRYGTNGLLSVFAGSGNSGYSDGNGIFTAFNHPSALVADTANNIYVWDAGNVRIRKIDQSQNVTTICGRTGISTNSDGNAANASFNGSGINAMCFDRSGNLVLACGGSVRSLSPTTNVVTLAGSFSQTGYTNGLGVLARFNTASGACVSGGAIYIVDSSNQRIRSITNNPTPQIVSPANLGIGTFAGVTITGIVGRSYQIQSSPDMNAWTTRATILLTSIPYVWIDQNPVAGNQFYRAMLLP